MENFYVTATLENQVAVLAFSRVDIYYRFNGKVGDKDGEALKDATSKQPPWAESMLLSAALWQTLWQETEISEFSGWQNKKHSA